jgi:hypothetical protein
MLNIIIQVVLGLFLILLMAFIAYSIFDREYINSISLFNTNKKETKIFTGIYPYDKDMIKIETFNRADPYYFDLNPSVNQNGGAEYSYNFWIYFNIKDASDNKYITQKESETAVTTDKYIVLFYKGVKQLIPYNQFKYSCDTTKIATTDAQKNYLLVKNPLVKINNNGEEIIIEYNNLNTPDTFNSSAIQLNCASTSKIYDSNKNKLGIKNIDTKMFNKMYNMITIVLQESPSNEEALFTNRTNCKVYFNGSLISDRSTYNTDIITEDSTDRVSTVMKKNMGNLYINPAKFFNDDNTDYIKKIDPITDTDNITKDAPLKMANLSYFNYALDVDEIYKLYNKGFSKELADIIVKNDSTIKDNTLIGSKINFDIYNSDNADNNKLPVESI